MGSLIKHFRHVRIAGLQTVRAIFLNILAKKRIAAPLADHLMRFYRSLFFVPVIPRIEPRTLILDIIQLPAFVAAIALAAGFAVYRERSAASSALSVQSTHSLHLFSIDFVLCQSAVAGLQAIIAVF